MQAADIEAKPLELQLINKTIQVPGEVKLNYYQTVKITPRIDAQIIDHHATLGKIIMKGKP